MNTNKYKIIIHWVNWVEHGAIEVFIITLWIGWKYLLISYNGQCFSSEKICKKIAKLCSWVKGESWGQVMT